MIATRCAHRLFHASFVAALALGATLLAQESQSTKNDGTQSAEPRRDGGESSPPKPEPADSDEVRAAKQPTPEEIIKAFQQDRPTNQPIAPQSMDDTGMLDDGSATPEAGAPASLLRDGDYINQRAGRIVRSGAWWIISFVSDGPDAPRPSMRLVPNQQLERIAREVQATAEPLLFVVSGEITLFESENYLLIRMAMRKRDHGNLQP